MPRPATIHSPAVTDETLLSLKDRQKLKIVDVMDRKVSAKGVADFQAAVPGCQINSDSVNLPAKK